MNNKKLLILFYLLVSIVFFSCSSSQDSTKEDEKKNTEKNQETYVFDEVPNDSLKTIDKTVQSDKKENLKSKVQFIVQIGAFTSKEKADEFVLFSKKKLNKEIVTFFSNEVGLIVVQLLPFDSKDEAEKIKNELWKIKEFKDAFILTK